MPKNKNQDYRFKIIDKYMRSKQGYSIKDLTEIINRSLEDDGKGQVTDRTVRNDIQNIQNEYPVCIIEQKGKFKYEDSNDSIDKFAINDEERNVLDVARQTLSILKGTPFFDQFDEISTRIMGSAVLRSFDTDTSNYIQIGEGGFDSGAKWLHIIYKAIIERKTLTIRYKPFEGELKTRTISPYLLKEYRNKWYMVAHARELRTEEKTNVFKLFRIESVLESNEAYIYDEHFNALSYFKYSLGVFHSHENQPQLIRLKFSTGLKSLIKENPIHASMKIEKEDEAGLIVNIYVYNTPELKNMIRSFGSACTVISPDALKIEIQNDLRLALANY
jgi:predicted DNA-binding transcriptional regulator YafY